MTRIVQALEAKGLVKKVANPEDRRTIHLSATMKGKRVMVEARERRVRSLAKQVGQLSREEQRTVRAAIGLMEGIIEGL
jgi:DNA-binding MarR family transcriptional regulator